jgi:anti-sigma factor RsiW
MTANSRGGRGKAPDATASKCGDARVLLMGLIDGELSDQETRQVEDHLAVCPACRGELETYQRLGHAADALRTEELPVSTDQAWERIYDRLTRSAGWLLLWVGITLMSAWGLWALGADYLSDAEIPLMMRVGVGTFTLGALLLLVNILRERLYRRKTERYDEVVR